MCAIFDDVIGHIRDLAAKLVKGVKKSQRSIKISCFLLVGIVCVLAGLASMGATVGYRVSLDGQIIATVKNKQQYSAALNIIKQRVEGIDLEKTVSEPKYSPAVVLTSGIDSNENIADSIIKTTDEIVSAAALKINGKTVAYAEDFGIEAALDERKNGFNSRYSGAKSKYTDQIEVEKVYCIKENLSTREEVDGLISSLEVVTEATVVRDVSIAYSTTYKKVSTRYVGDSAVIKKGVKGQRRLTERVTLTNGNETARETLSDEVLSQPTAAVVEVGTAKNPALEAQKAEAYSSGFIFPLPSGTWGVSAYYGDGRGHKGIDLHAPKGTAIYAVKGGTVTFSGYSGAYGYCVVVDHGNGLSTRYAHASVLCVSKGEKVSAGEVLALVGSTGRSTGPHLHFEVIKNGTRVNPAAYIGLG